MRTPIVYDHQPITRRQRTKEEYLLVPGLIAASDNVQSYLAGELKIKGLPPTQIVRVFRPKAEVDKAAQGFDGKPVTLEHPRNMVSAKTWRTVARGEAYNTRPVTEGLESDLLVRDAQAIDAIERGEKTELSAAYDFHLELKPGISPRGEAYDGIASDFIPNHIAITAAARGGHICHVADTDKGDRPMRSVVFDALVLGAVTGFRADLEEPVASQVEDTFKFLVGARDAAVNERDGIIEECRQKLETQAQDHADKMKALEDGLPARIEAEAQDRASVLAGAEKLGLKLVAEGKDTLTLRREVLVEAAKDAGRKAVMDAMVPDVAKVDVATAKLATAALFALPTVTSTTKNAQAHDALGKALSGTGRASAKDAEKPMGREAAMRSSSKAWMRGKDTTGCDPKQMKNA
jgi:hypothetical protein